jgi:Asp/Glu/hydantoin racemase
MRKVVVKIWYQLVSSTKRLPHFIEELQRQCDAAASPETTVTVSGTPNGALGDHYASFLQLDGLDIVKIMRQEVLGRNYQGYALANSLDPGLDSLREQLDIPVTSLMQVGCSLAPMLGDRFGIITPNFKFLPMYRDVVASHGFSAKLAGLTPLGFDRIADHDAMFVEQSAAERTIAHLEDAARLLVERGAEVILAPGPTGLLLSKHKITEFHGARILDLYASLVKVTESVAYLAAHCGMTTSRYRRYQTPSGELMDEAVETYGLDSQ